MKRLICEDSACRPCAGEAGFTTLERRWARPTCDVNGMYERLPGRRPEDDRARQSHGEDHLAGSCRTRDPAKIRPALETFLRSRLPAGRDDGIHRASRRAGVLIRLRQSVHEAAARGDRRQASASRRCSSARGARFRSWRPSRDSRSRYTAARLGPEHRQPAQPQRTFSLDDFHHGIKASARCGKS